MTGKRINRVFQTKLSAPPKQVFPLLCPLREYEWIPQWQCEIIYSESGGAELGCVFSTKFDEEYGKEVWVVSQYEPDSNITFVRIGPVRSTRYQVELQPQGSGSIITWRQEISSLNDQGTPLLEAYSQVKFSAIMEPLNKMLEHYLQHGTALDVDLSNVYGSRSKGKANETHRR